MNPVDDLGLVESVIGVAQAAAATLATSAAIGFGFLRHPGRPTLYWSLAFALSLVSTYAAVAGLQLDLELLRRIGLGTLLAAPILLWAGFRAMWGERSFVWLAPVFAIAAAVALIVPTDPYVYALTYRICFLVSSCFALFFIIDWLRGKTRRGDPLLLPLVIASALFFSLAATVLVVGFVSSPTQSPDLTAVRLVSSSGMVLYILAALVAVVGISSRDAARMKRSTRVGDWAEFGLTVRARLAAAQERNEPLSVIYLQIDDLPDIRQAAGRQMVQDLTDQLVGEIGRTLPSDVAVDSPAPGFAVLLIPGGQATVRDALRLVLRRITELDVKGRLPITPSASAGWATTEAIGYDVNALYSLAQEAALLASEKGGDRWERVSEAVTQRVLAR